MNSRGRRTRALLAAGALATGLLVAFTPAGPGRDTAAAAPSDAPSITVATFTPDVARPGSTLKMTGTVSSGAEQLDDAIVHVRIGTTAVALRDDLAALADGRTTPSTVSVGGEATSSNLAAGGTRPWSFSLPLDQVGLGAAGVYPVVVDLDSAVTGLSLAHVTTFLSWYPATTVAQPTKIVWMVPLVGTPARDADGVFADDRMTAAIAPGGRLRALLDAAGGTSASWVVDPELLEAVSDMSDGYEVRDENGDVVPGGAAGAAAAQSFLLDLRTKLATAEVAAVGYADPDVQALQRAGLGADTTLATTTGPPVAESVLGRTVRSDLAWPPGGAIERGALATLRAAGTKVIVLNDTSLPVDPTLTYTPTGLADISVSGSVSAVLSDTTLSSIVAAPSTEGGDALARARYLAETLLITQQRPSESRTIVVAPPRTWDIDASYGHELISLSSKAPWLRAASLDDLLGENPPDVERGPLTYSELDRKAELSGAQTDGAGRLGTAVETFTSVLKDASPTSVRYTSAQLRTESAAFRTQRVLGLTLLDEINANLDRDRSKVRIISRGTVTLSGATGQVPITVANDLDQSVVIGVKLVPSSSVKLRVAQPGEIRLGPHKKETVEVEARAATSGTVPVAVSLVTPSGAQYDKPVTIQVRSTAYSRVGLAIVVVALVALLLLVGVRLVRRLRRQRTSPDETSATNGDTTDDATDDGAADDDDRPEAP